MTSTVLIVDDDQAIVHGLTGLLQLETIDSVGATTDRTALEELQRNVINTRLLDLRKRFVHSLPDRVASIVETLRSRQDSAEREGKLDRQFHNLAGTAGTFGFFAIAAAALDGFDECAELNGEKIEGDARYLWSIVEELTNEACDPIALERAADAIFPLMTDAA